VEVPKTSYARSGDLQIAYQVTGEGPLDVVLVPTFMSNIEIAWELPDLARLMRRIASFARLILFDRRGNGMSDGSAGATLDEQIDDVRAVLAAAGCEQPALISIAEGCALSALFAASHPGHVRALVLMAPLPRLVRGPGYEWAPTLEERAVRVRQVEEHWGSDEDDQPWAGIAGVDARLRRILARYQRLALSPNAAAAAMRMAGQVDVRDVLPNVQCPTLVMRRADDTFIDERHSRYVTEHVPGARYVEVPGSGPIWWGDNDSAAAEIQHFLTGARPPAASDRVLATVMFTDIVGSTELAASLGDAGWRALLERHDALARAEIESRRGRLVKSLGDGLLALFDGPSRAIDSAVAIRDGVRDLGLQVRAGLHTGECELLPGDDVGGLAVHIGARIGALAGADEVLVSSTVRDLVVGSEQVLSARGEHELKGVPGPWRLFAVAR
jgi:class 3 adenylate cyclase/pimeloyl-ACP methyl ester carboxylesterase